MMEKTYKECRTIKLIEANLMISYDSCDEKDYVLISYSIL